MTRSSTAVPTLDAIARPSGGLAMVAMDQRESLRTMFEQEGAGRVGDAALADFKRAVAAELAPAASGFLLDRDHGLPAAELVPPGCGLVIAVDALTQRPGGPVTDTELDRTALAAVAPDSAAAIKLLLIWRRDERRERRVAMAAEFVAAARDRRVLSVLEPVVRATDAELAAGDWDPEAAMREAARELSPLRPSLYKAQVPLAGAGDPAQQQEASQRLAAAITGPWVVLSQGVAAQRFPTAVEAACRAGASGFLAGRALWSDLVGVPDLRTRLRKVARPRLERLAETVDRYARDWRQA